MSLLAHSGETQLGYPTRNRRFFQGFWLSLVLSRRYLTLKVLRLFPVAWVRVARIDYVRTWATGEWVPNTRRRFLRLFRTHHWPTLPLAPSIHTASRFAIITRDKKRIVVNLTPTMHYQLRVAVNNARISATRRKTAGGH